ncbi:MAG TPA: VWA domain-containing protein [Steroidobacteraceae bacterium]|jgi:hypothetical protein
MFLAPLFLAGLLAIGLPIWLHRVARANPTRLPFASLMLLEASETQRTAHRTLRYWLLLALRIALLLVLAFAFAGPLVSPHAIPSINPGARLHAIVIDRSMSMQYAQRWQKAVEQAQKVIDSARSGDRLLLIAGSGRRIEVVQEAVNASDAGVVRAALRQLKPGIERLDYGLLMSTSASWLGTPQLPVELHLISDLQRTASPLRFADLEPPPGTHLILHNVAAEAVVAANTYIKDAAFVSADTRALAVEVATTSQQRQEREAVVLVDGKEVERRRFGFDAVARLTEAEGTPPSPSVADVDALRHTKIVFPSLSIATGAHRIEVRLEPQDALPQDDRFYAVVEHADPHVLLVARNTEADDTSYFAAAIGSLAAPKLVVEQRTAGAVEGRALAGYSVAVVTDVAALSSVAMRRIGDYVEAGGALLVTLGPAAAAQREGQREGLLRGLRIGAVKNQPTRVGRIDSSHPILRDTEGWQEIRFLRHLEVEPAPGDRVLIALQDGAPLLIERSAGAGRMLILASPLDRDWNDLATHPLFVRFIAESARYLTGAAASAASTRIGNAVMTGLTSASGGQIFDPQGRRVLPLGQTSTARQLIPDQAGFYEVRKGDAVRWIAANIDARESDLTPLPAESLRRWQALRATRPATTGAAEKDQVPGPVASAAAPRSLGYTLMLIAAVLLVLEIFMANHYLTVRREVPR